MIELIEHIDPEILSLLISVFAVLALNKFRLFFVLSAKGNLLWIGVFTFLTIRFFLLMDQTTFGIQNTILLTVCILFLVILLFIPGFVQSIFKRVGA